MQDDPLVKVFADMGVPGPNLLAVQVQDALAEAGYAVEPAPVGRKWCQPPDNHGMPRPRVFVVFFEDPEMGHQVFENETEARRFYDVAVTNWNCTLFGAMPRAAPSPAPAEPEDPAIRHFKKIVDARKKPEPSRPVYTTDRQETM